MDAPFDNPVWTALTTGQRAVAHGDGRARRVPADVAPFVAVAELEIRHLRRTDTPERNA